VGGINSRQVVVNLRKYPDRKSQVVSTLAVGGFASLTKPASNWNYFYSVNQQKTVQKQYFKLGYSRVFGFLVLETKQLKRYEKQIDSFAPAVIISLSGLLFLFSLAHFRKRHQINNPSHNTVEPLETVYYIESQSSNHRELSLQEDQEIENHLAYEEETEQIEIEAYLASIAAADHQNDMAEMERTILSLKEKINDTEKNARIFGVNLNGSNNDSLLKGHLFEIFAAKIWNENYRTTIVDWTPDKGFNENIYVKSNGNPDFVLSDTETQKIVAVECKFRSGFNIDTKTNKAIWITFVKKTFNRYRKYQIENNITVFLLLGVGGTAEQPDNLYLLTLDELDGITHVNNFHAEEEIATNRNRLDPYKISKHQLIDYLF
jgi:hypothetical protein